MKHGVVKEFKGEYDWLSNFYKSPFLWRNVEFASGEHAFAYAKGFYALVDQENYFRKVLAAPTPGAAKGLGRGVTIDVDEWDKRKVQHMRELTHAKFANDLTDSNLIGRLLMTGAMLLVEGNDWGDTFWGRCGGKGFNTLGAILMEERGYWLWAGEPDGSAPWKTNT